MAKTRQHGFVIVVVLCMIICLTALLLAFNNRARVNLHTVDTLRKSAQALNCARSGLNIALAVIRDSDKGPADESMLRLRAGEESIAVGDGECRITATEENGKLNINLLKDEDGKLNRMRIEQLLRLIDLLNRQSPSNPHIGYGLVPAIVDWADSDDQVTCLPFVKRENMGAESDYYRSLTPTYSCKNAPLETVEELLLLKGVTPEILDRIGEYVTVSGDGKVNINYAPKPVIESLSDKIDPVLTQMIIDRRSITPFETMAELRDVPGMTDNIYQVLTNTVTVEPSERFYTVISQGNTGGLSRTVVATLKRNMTTKKVDIVLYREL
ncbi:MAG: general secretion pathway protein GspK [Phycisphaerales bacterium]|nr:MAG: general secretion pathway protein GspK [Phycisphaerales bacterium]